MIRDGMVKEEDDVGDQGGDEGERATEPSETDGALPKAMRAAAETAFAIAPVAGAVTAAQVQEVRGRLDEVAAAAAAAAAERTDHDDATIAMLHGRCAAIAI